MDVLLGVLSLTHPFQKNGRIHRNKTMKLFDETKQPCFKLKFGGEPRKYSPVFSSKAWTTISGLRMMVDIGGEWLVLVVRVTIGEIHIERRREVVFSDSLYFVWWKENKWTEVFVLTTPPVHYETVEICNSLQSWPKKIVKSQVRYVLFSWYFVDAWNGRSSAKHSFLIHHDRHVWSKQEMH